MKNEWSVALTHGIDYSLYSRALPTVSKSYCQPKGKSGSPFHLSSCSLIRYLHFQSMRVYPNVSGLVAWSKNCKWYNSLPLGAIVSLFCESV